MIEVIRNSVMITSFVFSMMLLIEYLNVLTRGKWQIYISKNRWLQYVITALLGVTPGCLGAFAVVTLFDHGIITIGAVVAAMIATSGDESFVMLALFPLKYIFLSIVLFFIGIIFGYFTDFIYEKFKGKQELKIRGFKLHPEDLCICFPASNLAKQWKNCTPSRGILTVGIIGIVMGLIFGGIGPEKWNWIKITMLTVSTIALFIVVTVPDHFLEEHLWKHVVLKHVPRIFLWTFGALFVLYFLVSYLEIDLQRILNEDRWIVLIIAGLIGLIPESGPHMIFVTLFSKGLIPFSILLTSSIVQDGHGMLPLLADSRKSFILIKLINLGIGLLIGAIVMLFGY
ncbi:MAG: hypothetical protein DRP84_04280 [Spirochaetes bacterium]|nr:MAG: hypothetical protein DRP84_04280 [Spirochaetota bacterium]